MSLRKLKFPMKFVCFKQCQSIADVILLQIILRALRCLQIDPCVIQFIHISRASEEYLLFVKCEAVGRVQAELCVVESTLKVPRKFNFLFYLFKIAQTFLCRMSELNCIDVMKGYLLYKMSTRWCCWLRHCATRWKVAGSIPDGNFSLTTSYWPPTAISTACTPGGVHRLIRVSFNYLFRHRMR